MPSLCFSVYALSNLVAFAFNHGVPSEVEGLAPSRSCQSEMYPSVSVPVHLGVDIIVDRWGRCKVVNICIFQRQVAYDLKRWLGVVPKTGFFSLFKRKV